MSRPRWPSLDIPDSQKRASSEADVRSTLFELDMRFLGYPPGTSTQADGEYFIEQRTLAAVLRRGPARRLRCGGTSGRITDVARGRQGLATADDARFLARVDDPRVGAVGIASVVDERERARGIAPSKPLGAVRRSGLTYSVVSSGRSSVRLLPAGWIFGHKGSAIFDEDETQSELFLLGYLNSALATYFMKKLVDTTATADVGCIEKLPYRRPRSGGRGCRRRSRRADRRRAPSVGRRRRGSAEGRDRREDLRPVRDRCVTRRGQPLLPHGRPRGR